jgi:hypothetical protein
MPGNSRTRKGGYTNANIVYEVSMAKRGHPVSKFARNAVKKVLQEEGMNLNTSGKIVRPLGTPVSRKTRRNRRNRRN